MALTESECDLLMACFEKNKLRIFYVKTRAVFGYTFED